jgi:hypothetical protein
MKLEFYGGINPMSAMMAEVMLGQGAPFQLKFITLRDSNGEAITHIFTGDEHAGVLGDLLGVSNAQDEGVRTEVRSRLISAGVIQDRNVQFGSESIERIFGIPEVDQTVAIAIDSVREEIMHAMGA